MLEHSIINALQKGGSYTFTILVNTKCEGPIVEPDFLPKSVTETLRDDVVELEKNDILDEDVQKQFESYFKENHLRAIKLDGKVIWKETPKKVIFMPDIPYTNY